MNFKEARKLIKYIIYDVYECKYIRKLLLNVTKHLYSKVFVYNKEIIGIVTCILLIHKLFDDHELLTNMPINIYTITEKIVDKKYKVELKNFVNLYIHTEREICKLLNFNFNDLFELFWI